MPFQITCLVLVLAITFMHSIFGFFSGIINLVCTIVAVCVSLGFYDSLSASVVQSAELDPSYTEPICLIVLFLLTLTGLRLAADNLIRGNVHVPPWMDWAGAGICGLLNAQLTVGILAIAILMLPLGGTVMMYQRYVRTDETEGTKAKTNKPERHALWTRPDEMTIGLFNFLSRGSLSSEREFASVYPNFTDDIFFSTNTVQPESTVSPYRDKKGDGFTKGLSVDLWWEPKGDIECRYRKDVPTEKVRQPALSNERYAPADGYKLLATRLMLDNSSADRRNASAWHLFRPTMLRIVGTLGNGEPADFVAKIIGGADELTQGFNRLCDLDTNFAMEGVGRTPIDVYFEVQNDFQPKFVEYRRHARAAVVGEPAKTAPTPLQLVDRNALAQAAAQQRTFAQTIEPDSAENSRLPFTMAVSKIRGREGIEISDAKLVKGRLQGTRSAFEPVSEEPSVRDFKPPATKRLLQIRWQPRKMLTLVGQVFAFVDQLNQFEVTDDRGNSYLMCGFFGIVQRQGKEEFEMFFNGDGDNVIDPAYKNMLTFNYLKRQDLQDTENSTIGLYFLVNPGVRIVSIRSGKDTQALSIPISQ